MPRKSLSGHNVFTFQVKVYSTCFTQYLMYLLILLPSLQGVPLEVGGCYNVNEIHQHSHHPSAPPCLDLPPILIEHQQHCLHQPTGTVGGNSKLYFGVNTHHYALQQDMKRRQGHVRKGELVLDLVGILLLLYFLLSTALPL